jgi:hypothetical protein
LIIANDQPFISHGKVLALSCSSIDGLRREGECENDEPADVDGAAAVVTDASGFSWHHFLRGSLTRASGMRLACEDFGDVASL